MTEERKDEALEPAKQEEPAKAAADAPAADAGAEAAKAAPAEAAKAPAARPALSEEEKAARLARAAEARAARAAAGDGAAPAAAGAAGAAGTARAKAAAAEAEAPVEKPPSPNQPKLEGLEALIREAIAADAVTESAINEKDGHLITLVIPPEHWTAAAELLKRREGFDYLRNLSGVDYETHLEAVYHLLSIERKDEVCVKVRTSRDNASIPSVTPIWATANWNEREVYDLLGIDFPGHPDLRRIMMPDDWAGYPLRKDYEPLDPEV